VKPVKGGPMAKAQFEAGRLAKDRAIARRTAARRFGETSQNIFYCGSCGAPVVDSGPGRLGHATRQERCREAMGI
jgi:hypothetical protein